MKKLILISTILLTSATFAFAQNSSDAAVAPSEITPKNSWLKVGLNAGLPIGDVSDISMLAAGVDLSGQFMATRHFGIGLATGYTHYFGKDNFEDFGAIPLAVMLRYYHKPKGFFAGIDLGYSFLTNVPDVTGGLTVKPEIGYHNYNWNFFAFYNHIFTADPIIDIQSVGIAASYNIRFK